MQWNVSKLFRFALWFALTSTLANCSQSAHADDIEVRFSKGVALYKEKKYAAALEEFAQARKAAPDNPTILYWIGFVNLETRNYADALEPLEQAVKLKPDVADAHLNLGNVYDGLKRYNEAVKEFQTVARLQPTAADPYYNMGSVYYKMKRYPEAVGAYKKAVLLNPKDGFIQDSLGTAQQASGDLVAAVSAYEKATTLVPANVNFWLNLGIANQNLALSLQQKKEESAKATAEKAWKGARIALEKAVKLAPANYQIRETYAETLFDMGQISDSIPHFEKASQLDTKQYLPVYNLALAQSRLGNFKSAEIAYTRALALEPESKEALSGLGIAHLKQSKYTEAAETFGKLTKLQPSDVNGWINLSSSLQKKGDEAGAVVALEEALKNVSKGAKLATVRRLLAGHFYLKGDVASLERAREEYTLSLQDAPDNAEAYNGLGLVAQKQGKTDEAIRFYQRAVAVRPKYTDAYNNLGVAFESKGDLKLATDNYKKALQADPKNAQAKKNLARLEKPTSGSGIKP